MEALNPEDVDAILASYESREVDFRNSTGNGELGEAERHGLIETPNKITHKEFMGAGVVGMVSRVSWGEYNGNSACLVVFTFALRSGDHAFRFRRANVKVTFEKRPSSVPLQDNPAVLLFAPRKIYGIPTTEAKKLTYNVELSAKVPAGLVEAGPTVSAGSESAYEKEHRFKTVGNFWSTKNGSNWDIVYWDVKENRKAKYGIPDRLNVGIIVGTGGPFQGIVEVTVDTPLKDGLFGFPWSKDNPVPFFPGIQKGPSPAVKEFHKLTDEDWRAMIPYEMEWQSKFVDEVFSQKTVKGDIN